jgi:hypothetical protein
VLVREVREQSESNLMLDKFMGAESGRTRMFARMRVALLSQFILALAMIMSIGHANGFVVERDILTSTMNRRREIMMGSSIKNSHDVTISQITDEQSTGVADNLNHGVVLISEGGS